MMFLLSRFGATFFEILRCWGPANGGVRQNLPSVGGEGLIG